jgi:CRISPR-associated RAMP protein (TIGR02581 family)
VIIREVVFEGSLVAESPLRIGVGRESPLGSAVDLAVLRVNLNGKLVPYIPGSSLKGVFRSTAIQLANRKGLTVCSGLSKGTCMDREYTESRETALLDELLGEEDGKKKLTLRGQIQNLIKNGDVRGAIALFHEKACLLCKVFGAPSFTGHSEFNDSYPINEKGEVLDAPVGVRTGIAINRRTGAVHMGALYQVEYVEPGARFRFSLRTTNLPNYALGLLAKILRMVNEGWVRVGGFKTRGFGELRVEDLRFAASGATVQGSKLLAVDEKDKELDLSGDVSSTQRGLEASGENAWRVLAKLEEVWDSVKLS